MRAAATAVVPVIQTEAIVEDTKVHLPATLTLDPESTSPVDNFGEPYLSMDAAASESLCSDEEPPSQILPRRPTETKYSRKRTTRDAHIADQEVYPEAKRVAVEEGDLTAPLTTSSPVKKEARKTYKTQKMEMEPPLHLSPLSQVQVLGKMTGAIPKDKPHHKDKQKSTKEQRTDGQHTMADDCGCHDCITKMAIIKNENIGNDRKLSKKFMEKVKKLKIYHNTRITSHPQNCVCKTHLEKINIRSTRSISPQSEKSPPGQGLFMKTKTKSMDTLLPLAEQGKTSSSANKVSSLRNRFEGNKENSKRPDPRTGQPPFPPMDANQPPSASDQIEGAANSIPVLTSR